MNQLQPMNNKLTMHNDIRLNWTLCDYWTTHECMLCSKITFGY